MSDHPAGPQPKERFPTTRWSRVVAASDRAAPEARMALAELCDAYWFPVYAFIRRNGHDSEHALDLTQEYFARLLERGVIAAAGPGKGRFRSFLRTDCAFFLADLRDRDRAAKRGGGRPLLSIDARDAEGRLAAAGPAEAGARIAHRPEAVARTLVAALDHWTAVRRSLDARGPGWRRLLTASRAADPDPDRDALRAAMLIDDRAERMERLRPLAERADAASWAPASLVLLGDALAGAGDVDAGVAVLRRASWAHPEDARIHFALGRLLEQVRPPQWEEVIRAYSVARALQPELAAHRLAHALEKRRRDEEAEEIWRDLARRRPRGGGHLGCYGGFLKERGRGAEAAAVLDRAVAILREAVRLNPDSATALNDLGAVLCDETHDYPAAEAAFRAAIRLDPDRARHHLGLGNTLWPQGRLDEAAAAYREALRLAPHYAEAQNGLGIVLKEQGKHDEAAAAFRAAIRLDPNLDLAHYNLGYQLIREGKLDEAAAAYREALRLNPGHVWAHWSHYNIGNILAEQGKHDEAAVAFREAIRLNGDFAEAYCNLGDVLRKAGDYAGALDALRKGHELGSRRAGWRYPSADWVAQAERRAARAERLKELTEQLPVFVKGEAAPADNDDRLDLAQMCSDGGRHAAAARFWGEALEADPTLADDLGADYRYSAACAAALVGSGQGGESSPPDVASRAEWRRRALDWLRAALASRADQLKTDAARARQALSQWWEDPKLIGVRVPEALAALPERERANWQALWAEVDRLLKGAGEARRTPRHILHPGPPRPPSSTAHGWPATSPIPIADLACPEVRGLC